MPPQDVSVDLAGKSTRQLEARWHTLRKIVGLSAIGLIFIVSALAVLYFPGNRTSMVQTGGLLLLCVSFLIMKAAERIGGPEMDKLLCMSSAPAREPWRRKKLALCWTV